MNAMVESVRSLWMPLQGFGMLVPNIAVAEVVGYQPLEVLTASEDWCVGALRWRGRRIPVVSIEAMCGDTASRARRNPHLAIMNSTRPDATLNFFAVVMTGIPRLIVADADMLGEAFDTDNKSEAVVCRVQMGDAEAMIPNLPLVQERVEKMWRNFS
jgi:chemosensory pili system protein ChpC